MGSELAENLRALLEVGVGGRAWTVIRLTALGRPSSRAGFGSKERSRAIPQAPLAAKKGKEAPRRQSGTARLEDIVTRRLKEVIPKPPDVLLTLTSLTSRPLEQEGVWAPGAIANRAEAHT